MCGPYWSQWDKSDLDSWQGIEPDQDDDEDDNHDDRYVDEDECGCWGCCSHSPCGNCMDCLDMSRRDFM